MVGLVRVNAVDLVGVDDVFRDRFSCRDNDVPLHFSKFDASRLPLTFNKSLQASCDAVNRILLLLLLYIKRAGPLRLLSLCDCKRGEQATSCHCTIRVLIRLQLVLVSHSFLNSKFLNCVL